MTTKFCKKMFRMVADLSHWINIAETNTEDPDLTAVIEKFADKFDHTHCRVGYDHGPQVPDPRKGKCQIFDSSLLYSNSVLNIEKASG